MFTFCMFVECNVSYHVIPMYQGLHQAYNDQYRIKYSVNNKVILVLNWDINLLVKNVAFLLQLYIFSNYKCTNCSTSSKEYIKP